MTDEPARMRWEDQPEIERDAFRLVGSPDFAFLARVLAALGRSDAVEAVQVAAGRVRDRLHAGVFRY